MDGDTQIPQMSDVRSNGSAGCPGRSPGTGPAAGLPVGSTIAMIEADDEESGPGATLPVEGYITLRQRAVSRSYGWQVPFDWGLVQSGPRFVTGSGRLIIANGPAWCSPLNGVGLFTAKPHVAASFGLLNQKPT